MIDPRRLDVLILDESEDDLVLEALGSWRRKLSLSVRLRLSAAQTVGPAGAGLALRRVAELTHMPNRSVRTLFVRLTSWLDGLDDQEALDAPSLASSASGLLALSAQVGADAGLRAAAGAAAARAIGLLESAIACSSRVGGSDTETALTAWLLAPAASVRGAVDLSDVVSKQAARDARDTLDRLCRRLDVWGARFDRDLSPLLAHAEFVLSGTRAEHSGAVTAAA